MATGTLSTAKAIQNFISRINFSARVNNSSASVINAISLSVKTDLPVEFLIQTQFENFYRLSFELQQTSGIQPDAKGKYQTSLDQLSTLVKYPALYQPAEAARKSIVEPNHWVLPLLDDRLGSFATPTEESKAEISDLVGRGLIKAQP